MWPVPLSLQPRTCFCVILELVGVDPNGKEYTTEERKNVDKLTALAMMLSSQVAFVSNASNHKRPIKEPKDFEDLSFVRQIKNHIVLAPTQTNNYNPDPSQV